MEDFVMVVLCQLLVVTVVTVVTLAREVPDGMTLSFAFAEHGLVPVLFAVE